MSTFTQGLPTRVFPGVGGVSDVAFIGKTAYALVTLVGADIGGSEVVGLYRIDGPDSHTVIADIGEFSIVNRPNTDFFIPTGVQYAMEFYRAGFLVSDGHHNRLLYITKKGEISEVRSFNNIVPTGFEVIGTKIFMAEAGPVPHLPEDGKVVCFNPGDGPVTEVAAGAPLLVDIEMYRGQTLFGLAQGIWDQVAEGSPAINETGSLVKVNSDKSFTVIAENLDQPTSMEFIQNLAYVVTLTGEVLVVKNIAGPPYGKAYGLPLDTD